MIITDDELRQINECLDRRGYPPVSKNEADVQIIKGNVLARYGRIVSQLKEEEKID